MLFVKILPEGSGQGLEQALRVTLVDRKRVVDLREEGIQRTEQRLGGEHVRVETVAAEAGPKLRWGL